MKKIILFSILKEDLVNQSKELRDTFDVIRRGMT